MVPAATSCSLKAHIVVQALVLPGLSCRESLNPTMLPWDLSTRMGRAAVHVELLALNKWESWRELRTALAGVGLLRAALTGKGLLHAALVGIGLPHAVLTRKRLLCAALVKEGLLGAALI